MSQAQLVDIARVCHEANRAYCVTLGDDSQVPWDDAPGDIRNSVIQGVTKIAQGEITDPRQAHTSWFAQKQADGWTLGPKKDAKKKTHPNLMPYEELPMEQQLKDHLFFATARTLLGPFRS